MSSPSGSNSSAAAAFHEGVRLHGAGRLAEASRAYRSALEADATMPEAHNNLGSVLAASGSLVEATECFREAVRLQPAYPQALMNLGLALTATRQFDEAVLAFEQAAAVMPESAEVQVNLGGALYQAGRESESAPCFVRALSLDASNADAWNNYSAVLRKEGRLDSALDAMQRAVALRADDATFKANLGLILRELDRQAEAEQVLRSALAIAPTNVTVLSTLAGGLWELGQVEEAVTLARRAVELDPHESEAWLVLANASSDRLEHEEALALLARSLEAKPRNETAHFNRALILLARGELAEGWAEYEWRWEMSKFARDRRVFAQPAWDGSSLDGRTILLHHEQGLGDTIQFARYAAELRQRWDACVIVEAQPSLASLIARSPGVSAVVTAGDPSPAFDVHAPLMSLPYLLQTTLESVPADVPYLSAQMRPIASRVSRECALSVGLVWGGHPKHTRDAVRSVSLDRFAPMADVPGVQLHALQVGPAARQLEQSALRSRIIDLAPEIRDFEDTAAAIEALDLVITVDTSVAHLAGALGKEVWILLPYAADFRWLLNRTDSPWYPTARLFRQHTIGVWDDVFADVLAALRIRAGADHETAERMIMLPSAHKYRDGVPRFTLSLPMAALGEADGAQRFEMERVGNGVDSEARYFLDQGLRDGDACVSVGDEWGLTAFSVATAPGRSLPTLAVVESEQASRTMRANALRNQLTGEVLPVVANPASAAPIETLVREEPRLRGRRIVLHVARPGGVSASIAQSEGLLRDAQLAAIVWPFRPDGAGSPAQEDAIAVLESLALYGFQHFVLVPAGAEPELVPFTGEAAATVFSLSPSFIDAHDARETSADWTAVAGPSAMAPMNASSRRAHLASPFGAAEPRTLRLGLDMEINPTTGWGNYALNLAIHSLARGNPMPVLFQPPELGGLTPLQLTALEPALDEHRTAHTLLSRAGREGLSADFPMMRALANNLEVAMAHLKVQGTRTIGTVFFEDAHIDTVGVARGRGFDRIVAGSTWNAEVMRAHGLTNVRTVIQGIDPTVFHPAPRSGMFGDRFIVFSGGKLEYRKGQDIVVAAFREFARRHEDAMLMVAWHNNWPQTMAEVPLAGHVSTAPVADALGRLDIRGWLARNGIPADRVIDVGRTPNAMMGQIVREAHVALFPNRAEGGTNLVAMECMASGVPTILSANTGHLDFAREELCFTLRDQRAVRAPAGVRSVDGWGESSVEEAVDALERAYADWTEAQRRAARASVELQRHAWSRQIGLLLESIADLF